MLMSERNRSLATSMNPTPLRGSFQFAQPRLWFTRAHLRYDGLCLTGWHLRGRYRREIPTEEILQVDVYASDRLRLWLATGETLRLRLPGAARWKAGIETMQEGVTQGIRSHK